jgi:GAF domain-containing protein
MFITSDNAKENVRLRALDEYAVFDTAPDVDLDRLVELAARMYGTPVAALSLVGKERLYFKSRFGMQATGIGREGSFCAYAIDSDGLFLVPDATKDERFAIHPLVAEPPNIRFLSRSSLPRATRSARYASSTIGPGPSSPTTTARTSRTSPPSS